MVSRILVDQIVPFPFLIGRNAHYIDSTIIKEASLGRWPIGVEDSLDSLKSLVLPLFLLYVSLICVNSVVKKKLQCQTSKHGVKNHVRLNVFFERIQI